MGSPHTFYPRSPQFKREIGVQIIGESWEIFRANPWPMVLAALLYLVVISVPASLAYVLAFGQIFSEILGNQGAAPVPDFGAQLRMQAVFYLATLLGSIIAFPFHVSVTKMYLSAMRGQEVTAADVFYGWRFRLGRTLFVAILYSLGYLLGFACCYLPGFLFLGMTLCLVPVMIDYPQLSVVDCFSKALEIVKPQFWMAVLVSFLGMLIAGLGVFACCVGVLATYPLWFGLGALAYRNMTMDPPVYAAPEAPAPPPPTTERPRPPE